MFFVGRIVLRVPYVLRRNIYTEVILANESNYLTTQNGVYNLHYGVQPFVNKFL